MIEHFNCDKVYMFRLSHNLNYYDLSLQYMTFDLIKFGGGTHFASLIKVRIFIGHWTKEIYVIFNKTYQNCKRHIIRMVLLVQIVDEHFNFHSN